MIDQKTPKMVVRQSTRSRGPRRNDVFVFHTDFDVVKDVVREIMRRIRLGEIRRKGGEAVNVFEKRT